MIELANVTHTFKKGATETVAIRDVNLTIPDGEFVALVGPSGCGKSTLLSLVSGLVPYQEGQVRVNGEPVRHIRRDAAMMLQSDVLLPWRTVRSNVGLALQIRGVRRSDIAARADEWIGRVGLAEFRNHYPSQLSGGMRKRVQLAATLIYEPAIVLMDEPFGALDALTRARMEQLLLDLWATLGSTVLFVTHDLDEAIALSDRVVVFTRGPGTVKSIYPIPIPRPRDVADIQSAPGFPELRKQIWEDLKDEVGDVEAPAGGEARDPLLANAVVA